MDLLNIKPDMVIHCAGLANVEACEADPQAAYHINVSLSVNVAQACKEQGIFLYTSQPIIFSPAKNNWYLKKKCLHPLMSMAKPNWKPKNRILDVSADNLSIRTNFYGWGPSYRSSFSDMIIQNIRSKRTVSLLTIFITRRSS
jgi:dTDP-4-dehydrorhamnose reductase